jgi:phage FluMu gp28-like protein
LTQHASPRWLSSKIFLQGVPKEKVEKVAEELAFLYPTWFFELYSELEGKPLVLEDYQIRYLLDDSPFRITNKCRQAGGSLMAALQKFYRAYRNPYYRCDVVSINLKEAIDKIRYIRAIHDTLPKRYKIPLAIDNATSIGFHKGARLSTINSLAASAGIRGGRKEILFDEYAHIPLAEELLHAALPAIMNGNLTFDVISTPKGNLDPFSRIWHNNENEEGIRPYDDFSHHQFIWLDVRRFVTNYEEVQQVWYNELHQNMDYMKELVRTYGSSKLKMQLNIYPWSQFTQEFCGVFLDETTAFFPYALIQRCLRPPYAKASTSEGEIEEKEYLDPWTSRPDDNNNQVFMGIDFGESDVDTDKTSIQILELDRKTGILMHRYSEVLNKQEYPDFPAQAKHIIDIYDQFRPTKVSADDTGLGRGINPFLRKERPDMAFDEVNFNFASKEEMVMNIKSLMEQGKVWLQQEDYQLQGQIRNIERKLTEHGRASYSGKPYDDMFWALALAARAGSYKPFAIYRIGGPSTSLLGGIR